MSCFIIWLNIKSINVSANMIIKKLTSAKCLSFEESKEY